MSWGDRPYSNDPDSRPQFAMPRWTPVVKWLIIANAAVFLLTLMANHMRVIVPPRFNVGSANALYALGGLDLELTVKHGQVWRFVTTQYLHGGAWHLLFNMIGLFFLGPPLERRFGSRGFFAFYTFCGAVAGLFFIGLLMLTNQPGYLIGASGSVLGLLAGCAILAPQMVIILLFFPVPIRMAAVLFVAIFTLTILADWADPSSRSDAAHLGGMVAAWAWVRASRRLEGRSIWLDKLLGGGIWERKQRRLEREQKRVDVILAKVHDKGVQSLSWREKRLLRRATERQRREDRQREESLRRRGWG